MTFPTEVSSGAATSEKKAADGIVAVSSESYCRTVSIIIIPMARESYSVVIDRDTIYALNKKQNKNRQRIESAQQRHCQLLTG
jgi:hypothetical protein